MGIRGERVTAHPLSSPASFARPIQSRFNLLIMIQSTSSINRNSIGVTAQPIHLCCKRYCVCSLSTAEEGIQEVVSKSRIFRKVLPLDRRRRHELSQIRKRTNTQRIRVAQHFERCWGCESARLTNLSDIGGSAMYVKRSVNPADFTALIFFEDLGNAPPL